MIKNTIKNIKKINIHFLSAFTQMEQSDNVDFKANGTLTIDGTTKTLYFKEPAYKVETIIIYDNATASISTGNSILKFELQKTLENELKTQHGNIVIYTKLNKLLNNENQIFFEYKLSNSAKEEIGHFKITIHFEEIKDN